VGNRVRPCRIRCSTYLYLAIQQLYRQARGAHSRAWEGG
jgi:hypothetical protein